MNFITELTNYETGAETLVEVEFSIENSSFSHEFGTEKFSDEITIETVKNQKGEEFDEQLLKEIYRTNYDEIIKQIEESLK
jgi:cell division ATPase FtsA